MTSAFEWPDSGRSEGLGPYRELTGQNMVRLADNSFCSLGHLFPKEFIGVVPVILEKTLTIPFYSGPSDNPLKQHLNES